MRAVILALALVASAGVASAQVVAVPPAVRVSPTLRLDTDSPAAGRRWATAALQLPATYVGSPWQSSPHTDTRITHTTEIKIHVINPNAAPTTAQLACQDSRGAAGITKPAISVPAGGVGVFAISREDFGRSGLQWCGIRADRPVLVDGFFYMREQMNAGIYEEAVAPFETWMLER